MLTLTKKYYRASLNLSIHSFICLRRRVSLVLQKSRIMAEMSNIVGGVALGLIVFANLVIFISLVLSGFVLYETTWQYDKVRGL